MGEHQPPEDLLRLTLRIDDRCGVTAPVVLVGIAISVFPVQETVVVFAAIVLVTVLVATRPMVRATA